MRRMRAREPRIVGQKCTDVNVFDRVALRFENLSEFVDVKAPAVCTDDKSEFPGQGRCFFGISADTQFEFFGHVWADLSFIINIWSIRAENVRDADMGSGPFASGLQWAAVEVLAFAADGLSLEVKFEISRIIAGVV